MTGREAVLKLRDELIQLVTAYNTVGQHRQAHEAQVLVIELTKFEGNHYLTEMEWPPEIVGKGEEAYIKMVEHGQ